MFFDTKNHLLPNTEPFCECAQDEDMAVCMAFDAYEQGCRFIMATPSDTAFRNVLDNSDSDGIPSGMLKEYQSLYDRIRRSLPDLNLGLGCEIRCSRSNVEEVIFHLHKGHYPTMNNSLCILVSFDDDVTRADLWFCLDHLHKAGYTPILSHAQSLHALKYDIREIRCLKGEEERGPDYHFKALIQIDTFSLHHSEPNHWSEEMIRSGVVDMLGTNAKNSFTHPPHIWKELAELGKICSNEYLEAITWGNAASLFLA